MSELQVGDVIKKIRNDAKLSLRDVSKNSGLSASALSQLENNKISPNLLTLKKIAQSLNVSVISLLASEESSNISVVRSGERRKVIRNSSESNNITEEFLINSLQNMMEPALITLPLATDSGEFVSHEGEEFVFIMSGKIEVELLGIDKYILEEGDTIYYPCTIPHTFRNIFEGESKLLIVATPPSF